MVQCSNTNGGGARGAAYVGGSAVSAREPVFVQGSNDTKQQYTMKKLTTLDSNYLLGAMLPGGQRHCR